ncbi:MAG TPA: OmpH family outer membrane protein, partial [Bryobacterales bacterium]|nr:OmpH family outer membrane protein [Bryobacterales bacterium]
MRNRAVIAIVVCTLAGTAAAQAPPAASAAAPTRVGIISIQDAIIRTEEGQKTAKDLQDKYAPRQGDLERKKRELEDLQAQLNKGRNTMSEEARNNLIREIDQKSKSLSRDNDDATADYQQEEGKLINAIGQKMMGIIDKYAKEKSYSIILDISAPQSPVLYAVNSVNITDEIVSLYDKAHPVAGATPSAPPKPPAAV